MKSSLEILEDIESRIEYLTKHIDWLKKFKPLEIESIEKEIFHCNAQIQILKSLWAFIKEK